MKQYEYRTVGTPAPLSDFDLNRYGQEGWHLCGIIQQTLIYYTFARLMSPPPLGLSPRPGSLQRIEPHEHQARASRKEPVVESAETTDQEGQ